MIRIDEQSPAWMHNLERFAALNHLLILHGNVNDQIPFDLAGGATGNCPLPEFLLSYLRQNLGYSIVGTLDPLKTLRFADEVGSPAPAEDKTSMRQRYANLLRRLNLPGQDDTTRAWNTPQELDAGMTSIASALGSDTPCAFVVNGASRLTPSPNDIDEWRLRIFTRFQTAPMSILTAENPEGGRQRLRNLLILLCEKVNDLPPFLYVDNPRARTIAVTKPERALRKRFFTSIFPSLPGAEDEASKQLIDDFVEGTEGLSFHEIMSLETLAQFEQRKRGLSFAPDSARRDLDRLFSAFRHGTRTDPWRELKSRLKNAEATIRERVKGQDYAINSTLDVIKSARYSVEAGSGGRSKRPRGVLFFAGPTGTGKTELAKALTQALFGDESRLIRFDMSEYRSEHADQRLMGAPPGYVGYQEGGQLTNAVKEQPQCVLLFDEIDKAHPDILLKFLQILDDGRLTDGHGETVYFSESILVFTSNEGITTKNPDDTLGALTPEIKYEQLRKIMESRISYHFKEELERPELLNRFGENFVVFDFIRPDQDHDRDILERLCENFRRAHREANNLDVIIEPGAFSTLLEIARRPKHQENGGRGIRNVLDSALVSPLHRKLFDEAEEDCRRVTVLDITENKDDPSQPDFSVTINCEMEHIPHAPRPL